MELKSRYSFCFRTAKLYTLCYISYTCNITWIFTTPRIKEPACLKHACLCVLCAVLWKKGLPKGLFLEILWRSEQVLKLRYNLNFNLNFNLLHILTLTRSHLFDIKVFWRSVNVKNVYVIKKDETYCLIRF